MFWRAFAFIVLQALAGLTGWLLVPEPLRVRGLVLGMLVASLLSFVLDFSRGLRVLRWLRRDELGEVPVHSGLWGAVADRVRRLLRAAEQRGRESEARLQDFLAAMQASPNGVVLLDGEGRIEWLNQTAAGHFGLDARRDLMQHLVNLARDPGFAAYVAGGDFGRGITMPGRGGMVSRPLRLEVHLHPYGQGRRLLLSRDITALEQAEAQRRDFVANVSHEIRTPLTVLTGFVETLQTLPLSEAERANYLALMAQQTERMQTLVSDLLTLSRLEGSPLPGAGDWIALDGLLRQLQQEAQALSAVLAEGARPAHRLQFDIPAGVELSGSVAELHSAMSNLVSNAIRYTPAGGAVQVDWRALADGRGEFVVRDDGPGIAPEHLPRLTERFYRVDRSRSRDSGGTGLGLAIVKHVAQRHGVELRIDSVPGKGSTFTLVFPAARIRTCVQ